MRLSIIMPVYNGGKTIRLTLESIVKQTCRDFELLIIDGASTDDTDAIIKQYHGLYSLYLSEPDDGYADALNKGIAHAQGDYVMMLAADDQLLQMSVENMLASIKTETDIWCGSRIDKMPYGYRLIESDPDLMKLYSYCSLNHPASMFRRALFSKYGGYDCSYKCAADRELFLRLLINGAVFQVEKAPVVLFCMGGISTADPHRHVIPEDIRISESYGVSDDVITKNTKTQLHIIHREKKLATTLLILSKLGLLRPLYRITSKPTGLLSKTELMKFLADQ